MWHSLTAHSLREVASAISSASITVVGAWLLAVMTGTVAIFAVLLVAALYAPLRGHLSWTRR
jgi:hypothetical protein